jgi:hypothetical protein
MVSNNKEKKTSRILNYTFCTILCPSGSSDITSNGKGEGRRCEAIGGWSPLYHATPSIPICCCPSLGCFSEGRSSILDDFMVLSKDWLHFKISQFRYVKFSGHSGGCMSSYLC